MVCVRAQHLDSDQVRFRGFLFEQEELVWSDLASYKLGSKRPRPKRIATTNTSRYASPIILLIKKITIQVMWTPLSPSPNQTKTNGNN